MPSTTEERAAVERLADASSGALVKTLPDGSAEVLAVVDGVSGRYIVRADGSVSVTESRPRDWRLRAGYVTGWTSLGLAFGIPLLMIGLHKAGAVGAGSGFVAGLALFAGIALLITTWVIEPDPHRLLRPDEHWRDWERIGWPEH